MVLDALSRLTSMNESLAAMPKHSELNALHNVVYVYTTTLVEMSSEFKARVVRGYLKDQAWKKILEVLYGESERVGVAAKLSF